MRSSLFRTFTYRIKDTSVQNGRLRRLSITQCKVLFYEVYRKVKIAFRAVVKSLSLSPSLSLILCLFLLVVLCVIVSVFLLPPTCFNSFARQCRAWTYFFVYVCLSAALKAAFVLRLYKAIKLDNICGRHVEEPSLCCSAALHWRKSRRILQPCEHANF